MYEQCAVWVVADAPAATLTTQAPGRVLLHYIFYPGKRWLLLGNGRIIVLCVGLRVHYAVYWWVCGWVCNWFLCYQSSFVCSPCSYSCSGLSLMQSDVMFAPSSDVKQENCSRTERWAPGDLKWHQACCRGGKKRLWMMFLRLKMVKLGLPLVKPTSWLYLPFKYLCSVEFEGC